MLINDHDKKIAKTQFQLFDKILSIQNIFTRKPPSMQTSDPVKRQEFRQIQKKNQEYAGVHCKKLLEGIVEFELNHSYPRRTVSESSFALCPLCDYLATN